MKFQSKWRNATYVVRATQRIFYPDSGYSKLVPGLIARFEGGQRIFDSEKAQRENGWTDDERLWVENHLLTHKDWKKGLSLAYGEQVPAKRAEEIGMKSNDIPTPRCAFIHAEGTDLVQCEKPAAVGREWCAEHDPETKIIKGMLTA